MVRLNAFFLLRLEKEENKKRNFHKNELKTDSKTIIVNKKVKNEDDLSKTVDSADERQLTNAEEGKSISNSNLTEINGHRKRKDKKREREKEYKSFSKSEIKLLNDKTHLHLQRKGITHIEDLKLCRHVRFLFLQENFIRKINHLRHLHYLQEIYLHDNNIVRIDGLRHLGHLRKLFLPRNCILIIENLPPNLEILDVRCQRLPRRESLLLDSLTFLTTQKTLKLLDISSNRLTDIEAVKNLEYLEILRASNNLLEDLNHVSQIVSQLSRVTELDFRRNPITNNRKYKTAIISSSSKFLKVFDDQEVASFRRRVLMNLVEFENKQKRSGLQKRAKKPPVPEVCGIKSHFIFNDQKINYDKVTERKFILGSLRNATFSAFLLSRVKRSEETSTVTALPNELIEKATMVSEPNGTNESVTTLTEISENKTLTTTSKETTYPSNTIQTPVVAPSSQNQIPGESS
ncbi:UNVERIFIED_CONTAM: hypothetical protein RMT77_013894 [Armadillidium vulgare]